MHRATRSTVALTLGVIGLAGTGEAHQPRDPGHGDGVRISQHARTHPVATHTTTSDARTAVQRDRRRARGGKVVAGHGRDISGHYAKRLERRQQRQRRSIGRGLRDGDLTRSEGRRLRWQQQQIDRLTQRFARDGRYSTGERLRLDEAQRRAARHIGASRHNDHRRRNTQGWRDVGRTIRSRR